MSANVIDIIVLVPILYGLVRGIFRGFVQELTAILVVVAGLIVARIYAPSLAQYMTANLTWNISVCQTVAYLAIFLATAIVLSLLGKLITRLLHAISLGWLNRLLGAVFGAAKWTLIMGIMLYGFLLLNKQFSFVKPEVVNESLAAKNLPNIVSIAWDEVKDAVQPE